MLRLLVLLVLALVPTAAAARETGTFAGAGGARIAYEIVPAPGRPVGAVVILPGYAESYLSYDELIADFGKRGYAAYVMDHRGMGLSTRLAANPQVIHIDAFKSYVDDAEAFVDRIVKPSAGDLPLYLFAHSTGGLIGAELLGRRPDLFRAAALSSPLLEMNTGWLPRFLTRAIVAGESFFGRGDRYPPGYADLKVDDYTFAVQTTTHSEPRFAAVWALQKRNPATWQSGPSNDWVEAVLDETDDVAALAAKVKTPVLVTQAGEDTFVLPGGQNEFCRLAAHCRLVRFAGARHEIFRETDDIRTPMVEEVLQQFSKAQLALTGGTRSVTGKTGTQ